MTVATYYFFLSKPENIIFVVNKIMKENYSIQYREIESDLNFLSPLIVLSDVIIIDQENNEIIKSDEIKIGLKIIKSILNGYIDLHTLSITNIELNSEEITKNHSDWSPVYEGSYTACFYPLADLTQQDFREIARIQGL